MIIKDDFRKRIAIIDYGMGNLFSVRNACERVGLDARIVSDSRELLASDGAILPGVGAFGDSMETLGNLDLVAPILDFIASKKPFLGICLGLQLLFTESEEFGAHKGLGVIPGRVTRFPNLPRGANTSKVPQVGWNQIFPATTGTAWQVSPLASLTPGEYMYFVHSFYCVPADPAATLTVTDYEGTVYCSGVARENVFAVQFHPEKSAACGLEIYRNWARTIQP